MTEDELRLLQWIEYWFAIKNFTPNIDYIASEVNLSPTKTKKLLTALKNKGYIDIMTYPELKQFDIIIRNKSTKHYKAVLYVDKDYSPLKLECDFDLTLQIVDPKTFQIVEIRSKSINGL